MLAPNGGQKRSLYCLYFRVPPLARGLPYNPEALDVLASLRRLRPRLMPVQRLHHRNARHHGVAAVLGDQQQHLDGELPWRGILVGLRLARDVGRGVLERDERLAVLPRESDHGISATNPAAREAVRERGPVPS
jgi:hypothetical protein